MKSKPKKYIDVTAAIIERDGKFLIAKRKENYHLGKKWEFPGGKVEPNETPEECLKRELNEEFGIKTEIKEFIAESFFNYKGKKIRLLGFKAEYISGDFQLTAHDKIRWVSSKEFNKFDFAPADISIINKIKEI